ncbi:MAG: hypothetical protein ACE5FK_03205 [Candidatus Methylomirabilia bacterium]
MGSKGRRATVIPHSQAAPAFVGEGRSSPGVEYRPLPVGSPEARRLFAYAALWAPAAGQGEIGWGAWVTEGATGGRMVGALIVERSGSAGMIHGPVAVEFGDPLEVAAQLLTAALPAATGAGVETLFARPQGLDRVWIRLGFIPVPEGDLPPALRGCPGTGLFAWRAGSALWSSRRTAARDTDNLG